MYEQGFVALKVIPGVLRDPNTGGPSPPGKWREIKNEWDAHLQLRGKYVVEFEDIVWYTRKQKARETDPPASSKIT